MGRFWVTPEVLAARMTRNHRTLQEGLAIPERDKLRMKIESREAVPFLWLQAKRIAE
jgi:hypothetical protein